MTSVWPALWPPWKRTTMSACSDSQSTILPLPSSPHCEPTTTTFAILDLSQGRRPDPYANRVPGRSEGQTGIKDGATRGKNKRLGHMFLSLSIFAVFSKAQQRRHQSAEIQASRHHAERATLKNRGNPAMRLSLWPRTL